MIRVAILGSTGSIGQNALKVVRRFPDRFRVVALSTNSNVKILSSQIREFRPEWVCVKDLSAGRNLDLGGSRARLLTGEKGLERLVEDSRAHKVLLAVSGSGALPALLKAVECGKDIALANKEALVMAGPIIMQRAKAKKIKMIPIDSEQSAIWQCLQGSVGPLKAIYLTASGGPFRQVRAKDLKDISIAEVLDHPRWRMGRKITVDSATLMNKGLELLEAMFLFGVPCDKIKILVHPEAIIHSMVEFVDGVVLAQLSAPDMRIPIQYALTYPERLPYTPRRVDFIQLKELHFEAPDFRKFPCLRLAYEAASELGTLPAVMNAANETSVQEFLQGRISFKSIPKIIERVMGRHRPRANPDLDEILETDRWARAEANRIIENL